MSDENIREIQLSGKQLVFLFMASVVVAVAIFLLGVSVGRGVDEQTAVADAAADPTEMAVAPGPEVLPEATETSARDLRYVGELQEQSSQRPSEPPPVVSEPDPDPAAAEPVSPAAQQTPPSPQPPSASGRQASPSQTGSSPQPPAARPPAPVPAPAAAANTPPPAVARGQWFVQVDSFRSRENADRRVAQLKEKGFAAFVANSRGLFQVRVGPFPQPEAERTATRLRQEGLKPLVSR